MKKYVFVLAFFASTQIWGQSTTIPNFLQASVSSTGAQASPNFAGVLPYGPNNKSNMGAAEVDISDDGRYVVFTSSSSDLVPETRRVSGGVNRIYRRDLLTNKIELVSVNGAGVMNTGQVQDPNISPDGRKVCFPYIPSPNDGWGYTDAVGVAQIMVKDMHGGGLYLLSHRLGDSSRPNPSGHSTLCDINIDNDLISFRSNGYAFDGLTHAYAARLSSGLIYQMDINNSGLSGNGNVELVSISGSGCAIVFDSEATNLTAGNTGGVRQVYVHYICGPKINETHIVSINPRTGLPAARGFYRGSTIPAGSENPSASYDGNKIVFTSYSPDLVLAPNTGNSDIFVHDMATGVITQVSQSSTGIRGLGTSADPHISSSGRYVVFESNARNLIAANIPFVTMDIFVHDMVTRKTEMLSLNQKGKFLSFQPLCVNMANQIYPAGVSSSGSGYCSDPLHTLMQIYSGAPRVANNGRTAFHSDRPLLGNDTSQMWDVYVRLPSW